jgi:hypothetical protein
MKAKLYSRKPTIVRAIQWTGYNWNDICDFVDIEGMHGDFEVGHQYSHQHMLVRIPQGKRMLTAKVGEYIVLDEDENYSVLSKDKFIARFMTFIPYPEDVIK